VTKATAHEVYGEKQENLVFKNLQGPATVAVLAKWPIKETIMIARTWHGVTPSSKADQYLDYLNDTGIPDYQTTPGNQGVYVLRRIEGDRAHFLLLSLWESIDAIKQFAGPDFEKARYYPEDKEFLLELEPNVDHYEVAVKP
jgi:heme-degrading monooxygenase HmoA